MGTEDETKTKQIIWVDIASCYLKITALLRSLSLKQNLS